LCSTDDIRNWEMTIGSSSVSYKPVILFVSFEYSMCHRAAQW